MVRTLCHSAAVSLPALALLLATSGVASAQAPGAGPSHGAPPPAPVVLVRPTPPSFPRWGIGLHLGGAGIESKREDEGAASETDMGLVGLQLRFRLHRRWELELDATLMEGELSAPGDTRRTTGALILGGMFHINPDSRWLWSVLLGIGVARDRVWYEKDGERVTQAEFAEGLVRLGVGLERRFDRFGIAAQLYGIGMARNPDELDGPDYTDRDGPVPEESSGGLFQLVANYYF